jgi:hypothetical protein
VDTLLKKTEKSYHSNAKGDLSIYTFSARKKAKDYSRGKRSAGNKKTVDSNEPSSLNFFLQKPELSGSLRNIRDLSPLSSLRSSDPSESTVTHHRSQQTFPLHLFREREFLRSHLKLQGETFFFPFGKNQDVFSCEKTPISFRSPSSSFPEPVAIIEYHGDRNLSRGY